ncbi:MAG: hypothetical protein ACYTX0_43550 [Nostoc sp.]
MKGDAVLVKSGTLRGASRREGSKLRILNFSSLDCESDRFPRLNEG